MILLRHTYNGANETELTTHAPRGSAPQLGGHHAQDQLVVHVHARPAKTDAALAAREQAVGAAAPKIHMSTHYIVSRTLSELRRSAGVAGYYRVAAAGYWIARSLRFVRRYLPGVRCESAAVCLAVGGWDVAVCDGDTGGGYSLCRLHAQSIADDQSSSGDGRVVPHVCSDVCDHGAESEWT